MPSAVLPAATPGEPKPANTLQSGHQGAGTAVSSGFAAALFNAGVSFFESLDGQAPSGDPQSGADAQTLVGGNLLPLAASAAKNGQVQPAQAAGDRAVSTMASSAGLSTVLPTSERQADDAVPAATLPELSQLVAGTPPLQAGSNPGSDSRLHAADITPDAAMPVDQVRGQAGIAVSADASIARLQRVLSEAAAGRGIVTTAQVHGRHAGEAADVQVRDLKLETLDGETDPSLALRLQTQVQKPVTEFAAPRSALDLLTHSAQSGIADASQMSVSRTPMSAVATDAQSSTAQPTVMEHLGRPEWGQGMGKQILWMVNQNIGRAEIRLNPANLGPMEVRIDMDNDQVNVAFTSRHAEVRDAVEQALPRLREMLEEKGLSLADTDISRHSFAEQQAFSDAGKDQNGTGQDLLFAEATGQQGDTHGVNRTGPDSGAMGADGLVDYYI